MGHGHKGKKKTFYGQHSRIMKYMGASFLIFAIICVSFYMLYYLNYIFIQKFKDFKEDIASSNIFTLNEYIQ